jgi:hypothetical protein
MHTLLSYESHNDSGACSLRNSVTMIHLTAFRFPFSTSFFGSICSSINGFGIP